jgi:TetR/AcrR family transcriptional repressor of nem operon
LRYRPEHKERTRRRILGQAGRLFRRHGYAGVGIDTIMAAARLTRGGFYGYFRSKADLFAQVLGGEHDLIERLRAREGTTQAELTTQAVEVVEGYLHPDHREQVGRGCYLASVSPDVARAGGAARRAYGAKLEELAAELARGLPGADARDPRALASLALCVGGLVLARAVEDDGLSRALLAAARDRVEAELVGPP